MTNAHLVDQRVHLPDDLLVKVDRCSMAVSLEACVPLLDHKLAEYVNLLPTTYTIDVSVTKRIMKDVMKRHLPADTVSREKKGFSVACASGLRGRWTDGSVRFLSSGRTVCSRVSACDASSIGYWTMAARRASRSGRFPVLRCGRTGKRRSRGEFRRPGSERADVECFVSDALSSEQARRWEGFVAASPSRHYMQSPRWAEVERREDRFEVRRPLFFWCERDGEPVLTGLAVRRRLPGSRLYFYEFNRGPVFRDQTILNAWLEWVLPRLGRDAVRLRLAPQWLLTDGGDDVETVLERHGFRRRRMLGMWSTLLVDISADEEAVLHGFRRQARQSIAKCQRAGLTVAVEDRRQGWEALSAMHADMALRVGVRPLPLSAVERVSRCWINGGADGAVLVAREHGRPVSGALVIRYAGTAYLRDDGVNDLPRWNPDQPHACVGGHQVGQGAWLRRDGFLRF